MFSFDKKLGNFRKHEKFFDYKLVFHQVETLSQQFIRYIRYIKTKGKVYLSFFYDW